MTAKSMRFDELDDTFCGCPKMQSLDERVEYELNWRLPSVRQFKSQPPYSFIKVEEFKEES